ncbi:MAG: hypothetical protein HYX53_18035 [Chloroflexi bacterium]|nr:hypothetical protein [Chloroflexota bacterium]
MAYEFARPPRPEFGNGHRIIGGRWPIVRIRGRAHSWIAENGDFAALGSGRTPEEAIGDWFTRNAEQLGFEVRRGV